MPNEGRASVAEACLDEARAIVRRELGALPVRVYLFGSRASGTARPTSDLDIAVLPTAPLPVDALARLRDAFEESTIPYEVDIVDLSRVDPSFRERVEREGQRWDG